MLSGAADDNAADASRGEGSGLLALPETMDKDQEEQLRQQREMQRLEVIGLHFHCTCFGVYLILYFMHTHTRMSVYGCQSRFLLQLMYYHYLRSFGSCPRCSRHTSKVHVDTGSQEMLRAITMFVAA